MIMAGWKKTIEVLPAIIVCGVTFAVCQWGTASYLGPYLPDIIASLGGHGGPGHPARVLEPETDFRL